MNKYIKGASIFFLMIFSFYYTEKVALYVQDNTPLKKEISSYKETSYVSSIDAKVNDIYITPGLNGISVNVNKSYNKMKDENVFNESKLVYDENKPSISIDSYPEKIINKGNPSKNMVSLIISKNNVNRSYLDNLGIKYDVIELNRYCYQIDDDYSCNNKRKIKPTYKINNSNYSFYTNNINSGDLIFIDNYLSNENLNIVLEKINFYGLRISNLENHLSESL